MSQRIIVFLNALPNSGYITKQNTLIDYGSGKGRVSIFMANQMRCHSIGIEYDERLYERAIIMVKAQLPRTVYPLSSAMQLTLHCQIMQIDAFSLTPLHFIPLNAY